MSGLQFSEKVFSHAFVKRPFSASIDQIEPSKGYTPENTRITCVAANFAMNQWGLDVLRTLARSVVRVEDEERRASVLWRRRLKKKLRGAERDLLSMKGKAAVVQKHKIAGLRAGLTKGPIRISRAAILAITPQFARAKAAGQGRD